MEEDKNLKTHFVGKKQWARRLFDLVDNKIEALGSDVKMSVTKAYIGFSRSRCFATIYVCTPHIKIEFAADEGLHSERLYLIESWRWNGWINRGVKLKSIEDVDQQILKWLKEAYERS